MEKIRENKSNLIELFKAFWVADPVEATFEEEIENYSSDLTVEEKKQLLEPSKYIKSLEKELSNHGVETSKSNKHKLEQKEMKKSSASLNISKKAKNIEEKERE